MNRFAIALLLSACSEVESYCKSQADDAKQFCADQVAQVEAKSWADCTSFYQDTVIPEIQSVANQIEANCAATCKTSCDQVFEALGCYQVNPAITGFGWRCVGSAVCR